MAQTTKRALAASFKELLAQKPFNKITIGDITEQCGVNRMTFYYHFHDIYDLARWAFREESEAMISASLSAGDWEGSFQRILTDLQNNRPMIVNICRSIRREELEQRMYGLASQVLEPLVNRELKGRAVEQEDWAFAVRFYTCAVVAILLQWVEGGMKTEPSVLARQVSKLCAGGIRQAAESFPAREE